VLNPNPTRPTDEARLADDPQLARLTDLLDAAEDDDADLGELAAEDAADLEAARQARALLRGSSVQRPPPDFLRKTQRKLRRRTGGRYFHPVASMSGSKFTIEVFAVIAVVVMAACWLFLQAEKGRTGQPVLQPLPETLVDSPADRAPTP
jgi:hypothetical protein